MTRERERERERERINENGSFTHVAYYISSVGKQVAVYRDYEKIKQI